jgi:amidohydrolase
MRRLEACLASFVLISSVGQAGEISDRLEPALPNLLSTYRQLHAAPELSHQESRTSTFIAERLKQLGYEVHTGIGRYSSPGITGYGVIAILRNDAGPKVLVRTELDGLPVLEKTGLPYASTVKVRDAAGGEVPVAHACGHDIHMTSFLGTAQLLVELKDRWRGTLMLVAQPAEEIADGAEAMLADGIYERFGKPDFALALHDTPDLEAGSIGYASGYAMAAMTAVNIVVRGIGGHGARPEASKDPIVLTAQIINALQTIVSRRVSPLDRVVVTVGSIHGGTKRNVIPEEVTLLLSIRTFKPEVRQKVLQSIQEIARFSALAAGMPEDRLPVVTIVPNEKAPATYNDPALTARIATSIAEELGADHVREVPPVMISEDFDNFSLEGHIPTVLFWLGASDPAALVKARESGTTLPTLHSPYFAPIAEPTIRTGVRAMTAAVLTLLEKPAAN